MLYSIDRKPDWNVFLNIVSAHVAPTTSRNHVPKMTKTVSSFNAIVQTGYCVC